MFDDIIQTPGTVPQGKQHGEDGSPSIITKEFSSGAAMGNFTLKANPGNTVIKSPRNESSAAFPIKNSHAFSHDTPQVPSGCSPFTLENDLNSRDMETNKVLEKGYFNSSNSNIQDHNSTAVSSTSTLLPKKKRRARAKKILTDSETMLAREKYLEKNRRAARKCRMKKKAEMADNQAKYDYYVNEIRVTKSQLRACRSELLHLIEVCKGMVGAGGGDGALRRFVGNWVEGEEGVGKGQEEGEVDSGVECWRLVERCRGARLGEVDVGDVAEDGSGNRNKGWIMEYSGMGNTAQELSNIHGNTALSYSSTGIINSDEAASYATYQPSTFAQQQLQPNPHNMNMQEVTSTLQQSQMKTSQSPSPTAYSSGSSFPCSNFIPQSSFSSPFSSTSPTIQHREISPNFSPPMNSGNSIVTSEFETPFPPPPPPKQTPNQSQINNPAQKHQGHPPMSRFRQNSRDGGYGSICSSHSNSKTMSNFNINTNTNTNKDTNIKSWSPDLGAYQNLNEEQITHDRNQNEDRSACPSQAQNQNSTNKEILKQNPTQFSCRDFVYETQLVDGDGDGLGMSLSISDAPATSGFEIGEVESLFSPIVEMDGGFVNVGVGEKSEDMNGNERALIAS